MTSATLYRTSGLALLVGALLGVIGNVLSSVLFPDPSQYLQYLTPLFVIVTLVSFIGSLLFLLGLPAIAVRQAPRAGWLGFVGFILTFIGGLLFTSFSVVGLLIFPWLAQVAPKLIAGNGPPPPFFVFFLVAGVLFAVGGVLLGIATMRAGVFPRWAGLLIIIGAVLNLVSFPLSGLIGNIVGTASFILFALGLGWIGYTLWSTTGETRQQAALAP